MILKDLQLQNPDIFEMVREESLRQIKKWGIQEKDIYEWLGYATEELGELSWVISDYIYQRGLQSEIVKEAIHAATLCLKIAEMALDIPYAMRQMKELATGQTEGNKEEE